MNSLKNYLDMEAEKPTPSEPDPRAVLSAALKSYRAALLAMGTNRIRACPPVGSELQQCLADLSNGLSSGVSPAAIHKTQQKVEEHLERSEAAARSTLSQRPTTRKSYCLPWPTRRNPRAGKTSAARANSANLQPTFGPLPIRKTWARSARRWCRKPTR